MPRGELVKKVSIPAGPGKLRLDGVPVPFPVARDGINVDCSGPVPRLWIPVCLDPTNAVIVMDREDNPDRYGEYRYINAEYAEVCEERDKARAELAAFRHEAGEEYATVYEGRRKAEAERDEAVLDKIRAWGETSALQADNAQLERDLAAFRAEVAKVRDDLDYGPGSRRLSAILDGTDQ